MMTKNERNYPKIPRESLPLCQWRDVSMIKSLKPPIGYFQDVLMRFSRNKARVFIIVFLACIY